MGAWSNADCQRILLPMMGDNIVAFVRLCKEANSAPGVEPSSVFDADTATGVASTSLTCSYSEMIGIAQQCSVMDEKDCRSGCVVQLSAFLRKCGTLLIDTFPGLQPTVVAFQSMVSECNGGGH